MVVEVNYTRGDKGTAAPNIVDVVYDLTRSPPTLFGSCLCQDWRLFIIGMWLRLTSLLSPASLQLDHGKVGFQ